MKNFALAFSIFALVNTSGLAKADEVVISGTGMMLETMRQMGDAFMATQPHTPVRVLPSMGSAGGLKALRDGVLDLSVSARRLKQAEEEAGIVEEVCVRTALVFVTQQRYASAIKTADLPEIYKASAPVWPDGSPLRVVLRARSGSEMPYLAKRVPGLAEAFEIARKRPELPVGMTDQLNARVAETTPGAFAIMTLMQIKSENLPLEPVTVDGVYPSPQSIHDKSYPFLKKVCVLSRPVALSESAKAFLAFMRSDMGADVFMRDGSFPLY